LAKLRAGDNWRQWESIDDERLCIHCAHLLAGREIIIVDDEQGRPLLRCPTPGCNAGPRDWFYHGTRHQHVLARVA